MRRLSHCAACLYRTGLGYDRISRLMLAKRKRVISWLKHSDTKIDPSNRLPKIRTPKPKPAKPRKVPVYANRSEHNRRKYYRSKIWKAFKHNLQQRSAEQLLGCSMAFFRSYIHAMLPKGCSMENYGTHWHLDHVTPCKRFDLSKRPHLEQCFHYRNYQPLTARKNRVKATRSIYAAQLPLIVL